MQVQSDVLQISYVGYQSKTITVNDDLFLDISITANENQLTDVVVTALGVKKEVKRIGYFYTGGKKVQIL
jgi:hypothetical protein